MADLRAIRVRWNDTATARRDSAEWWVADLLLRQPVIDAASIASALGIEAPNAQRAIAPLAAAGVLRAFTG